MWEKAGASLTASQRSHKHPKMFPKYPIRAVYEAKSSISDDKNEEKDSNSSKSQEVKEQTKEDKTASNPAVSLNNESQNKVKS